MNNNMEQKVIAGKSRSRISKSTILIIAVIISIPLLMMFITCCKNPSTPAGYEGYIKRGAIIGKTKYYGKQTGPTSTGLGWLLKVQNIDFRWQTYSEKFMVMSADNLELSFNAHIVMRAKPGSVKEIVEVYGAGKWYMRTVKEPFRNAVYEAVAGYEALEAKDKRELIAERVVEKFNAYLKGKPFEVSSTVIGTINLPEQVANSQQLKIAKQTKLEQKGFEIDIAKKDKEIRIIEAEGIAASQKIINSTLTPQYLQHEAIKAQMDMANSPNHSTVYIPSGANGIPLIKMLE
jgi:regulator of protease activity HflC (stomatin/prohibitin superfamily)